MPDLGRGLLVVDTPSSVTLSEALSLKELREHDLGEAERQADFLIDLGELRHSERASYIRGWLNRGFYDRKIRREQRRDSGKKATG